MKKPTFSGLWLVFIGAVFWSIGSPLVKIIPLDPLLVCGLRSATAAIALLPFLRPKRIVWNRWLLLYIVGYTALSLGFISALKLTSATVAVGMQYTSPVWLFLLALARREKQTRSTVIPITFVFMGVLLFMLGGGEGVTTVGNLIALTEGLSFALMSVSLHKIGGSNPLGVLAIGNLACALVVFCFLPPTFQQILEVPSNYWLPALLLGVVQVGCGYAFYNFGLRTVSAQQASIMALWEMILGPVWVAIFLHQYPSTSALLGLLVILAGLACNVYFNNRGHNHNQSPNPMQPTTVNT